MKKKCKCNADKKYSSAVMQGKRKLCECHTRYFFNLREEKEKEKRISTLTISDIWI